MRPAWFPFYPNKSGRHQRTLAVGGSFATGISLDAIPYLANDKENAMYRTSHHQNRNDLLGMNAARMRISVTPNKKR